MFKHQPRHPQWYQKQRRHPKQAYVSEPEAPARSWNEELARSLAIFRVKKDHHRERDVKGWPEDDPAPAHRQRDRIIEDVAMPPFRLNAVRPGRGAPAFKTGGANMLCSQLQIAQSTHESATPLTASLVRLVRMKKARRLIRHGGCSIFTL